MLSDDILYLEIPELLASRRHELGMTQTELAQKAGVSRHLVSDVENGRLKDTSLGRLLSVLNAVGLSLEVSVAIPKPPAMPRDKPDDDDAMARWLARYRQGDAA